MSRALGCGAVALVLATASLAAAQPSVVGPTPTGAQAQPQPSAEQQARTLTQEGLALYGVGRYDEAIAKFTAAHARLPLPALLFNIAQAYRLKGEAHCADALRYYRRFLREAGDDPGRPVAEEKARLMTECVLRQAAAVRPTSRPAAVALPLTGGAPPAAAARAPEAPPGAGVAPSRLELGPPVAPPARRPLWQRWPVWVGVGVAVVAVSVTTAVVATSGGRSLPAADWVVDRR